MTDAPRITGVRARAVNVPLARPLGTASGTVQAAPLVLLDLATVVPTGSAYLFVYSP
jgi:mandelate racemase